MKAKRRRQLLLKNSPMLAHYFLCHLKPQHTANWGFWTRGDTSFTHLVCWTLITCWQLPNDVLLASFFSIFNFGEVLTVLLKTSILFFDHYYWWEVDHVMTEVTWPSDSHELGTHIFTSTFNLHLRFLVDVSEKYFLTIQTNARFARTNCKFKLKVLW